MIRGVSLWRDAVRPNDPKLSDGRARTPRVTPRLNPPVRCSAWLGVRPLLRLTNDSALCALCVLCGKSNGRKERRVKNACHRAASLAAFGLEG